MDVTHVIISVTGLPSASESENVLDKKRAAQAMCVKTAVLQMHT